ncbi:hypothetical protein [uncultured Bacteroides sp.]|uniref:hypothetical protein n=1 Tax=uncultured Bacteroides sp. TaxID=162156 RepID=UPI002582D5BD|nr:hypothetical protein [uncultured Bacteroides sp.]
MKKLLLMLLPFLLLSSCMTMKSTPSHLVGVYNVTTSIKTDNPFDEVWNKVIDYFATNGIPIATLEKASGLIVSNKVQLKDAVTIEQDGKPLDKNAYIVIPYAKNIIYKNVTSDFNVRVREVDGKVVITVNLPNIVAERTIKPTGFTMISVPENVEAKSTGVFEAGLLNLFK